MYCIDRIHSLFILSISSLFLQDNGRWERDVADTQAAISDSIRQQQADLDRRRAEQARQRQFIESVLGHA